MLIFWSNVQCPPMDRRLATAIIVVFAWNTKSVQEVSKQIFAQCGQEPIYEGAGRRIRTDDLLITNQLLYQLSYAGISLGK